MRLNRLILILSMFCGLILISSIQISAQSKENGALTQTTLPTAPVAELQECSELLDKSISEKSACVKEKDSLGREIVTLRDLAASRLETITKQDALLKIQTKKPSRCIGIGIGSFCIGAKY